MITSSHYKQINMKKLILFSCAISLTYSTISNAAVSSSINEDCQSVAWYTAAAEQGNAIAQDKLGMLYLNGDEVKSNYKKGFELLNKAAQQDNIQAQLHLAFAYEMGIGTKINTQDAFHWYFKAANLGNTKAQYKVANMYQTGTGISKDLTQANAWYQKASSQN